MPDHRFAQWRQLGKTFCHLELTHPAAWTRGLHLIMTSIQFLRTLAKSTANAETGGGGVPLPSWLWPNSVVISSVRVSAAGLVMAAFGSCKKPPEAKPAGLLKLTHPR